jgi:hypothetical protein
MRQTALPPRDLSLPPSAQARLSKVNIQVLGDSGVRYNVRATQMIAGHLVKRGGKRWLDSGGYCSDRSDKTEVLKLAIH